MTNLCTCVPCTTSDKWEGGDEHESARSPLLTSTTIVSLAEALAKAQGAFPAIGKDKTAKIETTKGSYSYSYADLADVLTAVRPVLAANGLSVIQPLVHGQPTLMVTRLMHASGEWIESTFAVTVSGRPQDTGSAITYARRYALTSLLGIAADHDDDGAAATKAARQEPHSEPAPESPAPEVGSPEHEYRRRNLAFRNIKDAIGDDPDRRAKAKEVADRLGIVLAEAGASETEAVAAAVIRFFETGELPPEATPREPEPAQGATEPESEASGPDQEPSLAERIRQQAGSTSWTPNIEERKTAHDAWGEHTDAAHHDAAIKEARANLVLSIVEVIAANEWDEPRVRTILGAGPRKNVTKAVAEARLGDLRTTLDMLEAESPPPLDENHESGQ